MKLLALDTSTEACSVALVIDGHCEERFALAPREHATLVLAMAEDLLAGANLGLAQLDALAFGRGPGAFTGVRIGVGVAQGLAFGAGLPLVPVSTLAALAHTAWRVHGAAKVVAALDARMGEVYWANCTVSGEGNVVVEAERVSHPSDVTVSGENWFGAGSGWATYAAMLSEQLGVALGAVDAKLYPHAQDVAALGLSAFAAGVRVAPAQAQPVYLRDQVTHKGNS
ncbi:MAG: hypothetical protein AMJ69_05670 [Gammaproteobacteria bacterium SG8_47]|nr:MAG: hypothetical protein AMJ69_05670 [Gammaproteobacteria bacterium SG8_47]